MLLLLIGDDNLLKAQFQDGYRIRKLLLHPSTLFLPCPGRGSLRLIKGLIIKLDGLIPFLQALLKLLDFQFKLLLLFLMFSLQSQNLVVSLISVLASLDVVLIGDSGLFLDLANLLLHLDYGVLGKEYLFAHDVNLCLHILVPSNRIIQVHSLVSQQVVDVATGDLLQVEILL